MESKDITRKLNFVTLLLVVITLPYSIWWNGFFLILFYATSIALIVIEKDKIKWSQTSKKVLLFISPFIVYLLVVILSRLNHDSFLKKISILLFPLFLGTGVLNYNHSQIRWLPQSFVAFTFVASILPFIDHFNYLVHQDIAIQDYLVMDRPSFALYSFFALSY